MPDSRTSTVSGLVNRVDLTNVRPICCTVITLSSGVRRPNQLGSQAVLLSKSLSIGTRIGSPSFSRARVSLPLCSFSAMLNQGTALSNPATEFQPTKAKAPRNRPLAQPDCESSDLIFCRALTTCGTGENWILPSRCYARGLCHGRHGPDRRDYNPYISKTHLNLIRDIVDIVFGEAQRIPRTRPFSRPISLTLPGAAIFNLGVVRFG